MTSMKLFIRSLLIGTALIVGCKATKDSASVVKQTQTLEELIATKYLGQSTVLFNESQTYALVKSISQKGKVKGQSSIHFFVYDKANEEIILEDFINKGTVEWESDNILKINDIPGVYKEDASLGYTFNVISKTRKTIKITD